MIENVGTILHKGIGTWKRNLVLCIPSILEFLSLFILIFIAIILFAIILALSSASSMLSDTAELTPEMSVDIMSSLISENLWVLVIFFILVFLVSMLIQSFFMAGAIGMSKEASEKGDTSLRDMFAYGKKNMLNMFLAKILVLLLTLAGVVALIPGVLSIGDATMILDDPVRLLQTSSLLILGFVIWAVYSLIMGLVLTFVSYIVVIEDLDPLGAIEKSIAFFRSNIFGIFTMWLFLTFIALIIQGIDHLIGTTGPMSNMWAMVYIAIMLFVVQPLTLVWWTRMYMNRTGKKLYSLEDYILRH